MSAPADLARPAPRSRLGRLGPYVAIARPDHWLKNVFMVLGVLLAAFYQPDLLRPDLLPSIAWAVLATCVLASSNYVLNEILDATADRHHPAKRQRPIPRGQVRLGVAWAECLLLAALGLGLAAAVNWPFLWTAAGLLVTAIVYNVPPIRSKELPYLDVLSESVNNPIRLMLGWFVVNPSAFPPVSLLIAYWMVGAFFMASKRLAEYRAIGDPAAARAYRSSFRHYDEQKLLVGMFFSTICFALFLGIFIVRYHLELILGVPLVAGCLCYYLHLTFKPDSPAQSPERLYGERGFVAYLLVCAVALVGLMFVQIPVLYDWFNVQPSPVAPLWRW